MTEASPFYTFGQTYSRIFAETYDFATGFTGYARTPRVLAREIAHVNAAHGTQNVLDFGCGTGQLTSALLKLHQDMQVTGMDPNAEMLVKYRQKFSRRANVRTAVGGYNGGLDIPDDAYDIVAATGVFDHFRIEASLIRTFMRIIRPGGLLAFTYERHTTDEPCKINQGAGRIFYSHTEDQVRRSVEDAGYTIAAHKRDRIGYFVNFNHTLPQHVKFNTLIVRK